MMKNSGKLMISILLVLALLLIDIPDGIRLKPQTFADENVTEAFSGEIQVVIVPEEKKAEESGNEKKDPAFGGERAMNDANDTADTASVKEPDLVDSIAEQTEKGTAEPKATRESLNIVISGISNTYCYNGDQQVMIPQFTYTPKVDGLVVELKDPAAICGSEPGNYSTNWTETDFKIEGYEGYSVTIEKQATLEITPLSIQVTVSGETIDFDGKEHTAEGYEISVTPKGDPYYLGLDGTPHPLTAAYIEKIYTTEKTKYEGTIKVTGKLPGKYPMTLQSTLFENLDKEHFIVDFSVGDAFLEIRNREVPFCLVLKSDDVHTPYNGYEQTYTIRRKREANGLTADITAINPVTATINFIINKISNFFGITASAAEEIDDGLEFICEGVEYVCHNCEATASGRDVGEYKFEQISDLRITLDGTDVTDQFDIMYEMGDLIIDPSEVTITVDKLTKMAGEKDPELTGTVTGIQGNDVIQVLYKRDPGNEVGHSYTIYAYIDEENVDEKILKNYTFTVINGELTVLEAYTVTFVDEDGKTVLWSEKTVSGEKPSYKGKTPTKEADEQYTYSFAGWDPPITEVSGEGIYKAKFDRKLIEYTVTFEVNGHGNVPAAQSVKKGEKASKPQDPTEEGYTFDGWFTDEECNNAFDFTTEITQDVTLYAKWTIKEDTLSEEAGSSSKGKGSSASGGSNGSSSGTSSPKTGDDTPVALWLMMMAIALPGMILVAFLSVRRMRRQ